MEHVVFSAAEGGVGEEFRRVSSLEEAVRVVEHLRNDLGVMEPSVYALTPVPLAFRTYYRVEMPAPQLPTSQLPVAEPAIAPDRLGDTAFVSPTADSDEFAFEPNEDVPVPAMLPADLAIPRTHQDSDPERSLGYFAR
jgi:hypothetical protein